MNGLYKDGKHPTRYPVIAFDGGNYKEVVGYCELDVEGANYKIDNGIGYPGRENFMDVR